MFVNIKKKKKKKKETSKYLKYGSSHACLPAYQSLWLSIGGAEKINICKTSFPFFLFLFGT